MSTRNKARKSTGGRGAINRGTSNNRSQRSQRSNTTFSLQQLPSSSSDSEAPTQPLNIQVHSSAGPSGINRRRLESSDSDPDGPPQKKRGRKSNQSQNIKVIQREESTSSSSTSDSDDIPGREIEKESKAAKVKKKKIKPKPANRRKIRNSAETEGNEEVTQSSPLQTQSLSQGRNIVSLANKCVYYLLVADQKKYAIKKSDILKHVFINQDRKLYGTVIEEANNVLKKNFGMEILASEKRKGEYILINILNRDLGLHFAELNSVDLQKRGLIFYLLTVIFMNERSISENELWEAMKPLGIDATAKLPHPVFGDVKKYLTNELVKQMYLEYNCISKDPPEFEFTWGERARQEFDKKDILDFACKIIGDTKPEEWILQYKDAMGTGRPDD